jgi:DNA-binding response OmpR family regulator
MMPEMDGFEVLRRLKAAPETSSIPVILLSALDQLKNISTCYEMGADHYITKPFNNAHLMTVIDHLLNGDRPVVRETCLRVVFAGSTTGRRRSDNTIGLRAEYRGGLITS